jgi:hypothetical protein
MIRSYVRLLRHRVGVDSRARDRLAQIVARQLDEAGAVRACVPEFERPIGGHERGCRSVDRRLIVTAVGETRGSVPTGAHGDRD